MYPKYHLKNVESELSKRFKVNLILSQDEDGFLDVQVSKVVTKSTTNSKLISIEDAKKLGIENPVINDTVVIDIVNDEERDLILKSASSRLESMKMDGMRFNSYNKITSNLQEKGIVKGALLECTVSKALPLGDILLDCDRIPGISIVLPRDKCISEQYIPGNNIYVLVDSITVVGNNATIYASRKNKNLIKELILQSTLMNDTEGIEIQKFARIPDRGSRVFISGDFSKFIGKNGSNVKSISDLINREFIRFLQYDSRLPIRVINSLVYDASVLDIYYPEETGIDSWTLVIRSDQFKSILRGKAEALMFTKMLTGVRIKVQNESYTEVPHKEYVYDGELFKNDVELVKRYYCLAMNSVGITSDSDLISKYNSMNIPDADKEYIKYLIHSNYDINCPYCGSKIGLNDKVCPECNADLNEE